MSFNAICENEVLSKISEFTVNITMEARRVVWIILSCAAMFNVNATLSESDLHNKLFEGYSSDARPRRNISESVNVKLDLFVMSIDKIDEIRQTFTIRAFMEVTWRDDFLIWVPAKYGGVTTINVPNTKLWLPDLALLDVYDSPTDLGQEDGRAVVDQYGNVTIWPYKMYTVGCKIKIRHFPFDVQNCSLDFLSWTHPISSLDIKTSERLNLDRYSESAVWELKDHQVSPYLQTFGKESWKHIEFVFHLRRKWLFHLINIIIPIVVISSLNVTCFLLPAATGEKITLCISIFLTLAVFLTIIASSMPESSDDVSILAVYVGLQLLGSALSILATVASLCIYNRDKSVRMSKLMRLLCKIGSFHFKKKDIPENKTQRDNSINKRPLRFSNGDTFNIRDITDDVEFSAARTQSETHSSITWETVSRAFDRLFLWLTICWQICLFVCVLIGLNL